ncbi:broad-complex core protein [Lycorma delicatula]|uniref:broad-complex core protein n=1 Tax=Lycorma delicatula TaxID=130591 RepID=UPI003F50E888
MGDLQHFCLRWNNYQSSITSAFENLRDDEDFVDVTLACEGKSLKAHRVVLSACSPYFRELLKSTPCKHPVIVLQDVVYEDLHALVEFIYHGEVNVHQQSLSSFLKTAEVLRVSGLTQQAEASGMGEKWCRDSIPDERGASPSHFLSRPGRPPLNSHHHRGPPRERPSSAGEASDQQDNSVPMKRAKTSSESVNHMTGGDNQQQSQSLSGGNSGKQESESDQEPPVDFSTNPVPKQPSTKKELSSSGDLPSPLNNLVKSEPIDMALCSISASGENNDDSNDSANDIISESGGGNGNGNNLQQSQEHDDNMQSGGGNHHGYLDSKLFAAGASFNFSMAAALAADSLAGLNNQSHVSGVDGLAGTSQEVLVMPPPLSGGINEPQDCPYCRRTFSCYYSLKRHFQDKHERSDTLYVCEFCHRRYRTKNSLTTHKSLQHRGTSGMLKRLLKTSAVFGQPPL